MRSFKTEGIILKRKDTGEADRIITVFTKKHGKVKILAKGVRRIKSRRSPNIELFNLVSLFVHKGRTFDILVEAEAVNTFQHIRKNLELIGLAYYCCELIDGLCAEGQPNPHVYELLIKTLNELDCGLLQNFEAVLLSELGFLPVEKAENMDVTAFIENILERRIKSRRILSKLA
jgi:DNA repair protein RecO (recombination protein O)